MRLFAGRSNAASSLAITLLLSHTSSALVAPLHKLAELVLRVDPNEADSTAPSTPVPSQSSAIDNESLYNSTSLLDKRQQACNGTPCGYYKQLCCVTGTACYTDANNQAQCMALNGGSQLQAANGAGSYVTYTAIYISLQTVTYTTAITSWVPSYVAPTAVTAVVATCSDGRGYCGGVCCGVNDYCYAYASTCGPINGFTTMGSGSGATAAAPARPTGVTNVIVTATISPTTVIPFVPAVSATMASNGTALSQTSGGGGLSGGAIAGIVIGVLLGLALLFLICFCCCLKAGIDGILAIFGIGKKKDKDRRTYIEEEYVERHRRHGSAGQSAAGRTWYGSGYDRPSRPPPSRRSDNKKKKEGLGLLGGLAGLAAVLGIKRKLDQRKDEKSSYTGSSYDSYYYYDSSSSGSRSDRGPRRDSRSHSRR